MSAHFLFGSQLSGALGLNISAETVATGAAQNVAHGLSYTPTDFIFVPTIGSNGAGAAGVQLPAASTTVTAGVTNLVITCPAAFAGGSFRVLYW